MKMMCRLISLISEHPIWPYNGAIRKERGSGSFVTECTEKEELCILVIVPTRIRLWSSEKSTYKCALSRMIKFQRPPVGNPSGKRPYFGRVLWWFNNLKFFMGFLVCGLVCAVQLRGVLFKKVSTTTFFPTNQVANESFKWPVGQILHRWLPTRKNILNILWRRLSKSCPAYLDWSYRKVAGISTLSTIGIEMSATQNSLLCRLLRPWRGAYLFLLSSTFQESGPES